jgi:hypothetical protein
MLHHETVQRRIKLVKYILTALSIGFGIGVVCGLVISARSSRPEVSVGQ